MIDGIINNKNSEDRDVASVIVDEFNLGIDVMKQYKIALFQRKFASSSWKKSRIIFVGYHLGGV